MRVGVILVVVFVAALALGALLWWRFLGPGRPAAAPALVATRNHPSLPLFHYAPTASAPPAKAVTTALSPTAGGALARLLPAEDERGPEEAHPAAEAQLGAAAREEAWPQPPAGANDPAVAAHPAEVPPTAPPVVSSRHAAGARASLLEAPGDAPVPTGQPGPATPAPPEAAPAQVEEAPAPSLFYNPITAPAPTSHDQANRAAEIAARQQRRARVAADSAGQRTALSGLFTGPTGQPAGAQPA